MRDLTVGRVRRPHGLAGELLVQAETDDGADVFRPGRRFGIRPPGDRPPDRGPMPDVLTLAEGRPHRGGFLLRFREIADRDSADALRGVELLLERDELRPLARDEYFLHELVGLEVVDESQGRLGPVADVYDTAGQVLAGVMIDGRERLFPLLPETVRRVDMEAGLIEVTLPSGLLKV